MAKAIAKSGLAALLMGLALLGWLAALANAGALVRGVGGIVMGLSVYFVAALVLRSDELRALARLARQR